MSDRRSGRRRSRSRSPSRSSSRGRDSRSRSSSRSRSRSESDNRRRRSRSRSPVRGRGGGRYSRRSRSRSRSPRYRRGRSRSRSPFYRKRYGGRVRVENPSPCRCLGVFGLSLYTNESDLKKFFSKYGPIEDIQIVYDRQTGRSRGFGFVYFDDIEDAKDAKEKTNGAELDGRRIRVDYSVTKRPHTPTPGIYMGKASSRSGGREDFYRRSPSPYYGGGRSGRYSRSPSRSPPPPRRY